MTALPDKPSIIILVKDCNIINVASNIAKNVEVIVTEEPRFFANQALGQPFIDFPITKEKE